MSFIRVQNQFSRSLAFLLSISSLVNISQAQGKEESVALAEPTTYGLFDGDISPEDGKANVYLDSTSTGLNIWNGASCKTEVCLSLALYQNKFYVYLFTTVPLTSIKFSIMLNEKPMLVSPSQPEGVETIDSKTFIYVEEPSETIVTQVPAGMPAIEPMDPEKPYALLGVYDHVGDDGNSKCAGDNDQSGLNMMIDCSEVSSFTLGNVQIMKETASGLAKLPDSGVKYSSDGPSRNDPVCCCFVNIQMGYYGPADLTFAGCLTIANNGVNALYNGWTQPLLPTCQIYALGTCANNEYEYVYNCCPTSFYG